MQQQPLFVDLNSTAGRPGLSGTGGLPSVALGHPVLDTLAQPRLTVDGRRLQLDRCQATTEAPTPGTDVRLLEWGSRGPRPWCLSNLGPAKFDCRVIACIKKGPPKRGPLLRGLTVPAEKRLRLGLGDSAPVLLTRARCNRLYRMSKLRSVFYFSHTLLVRTDLSRNNIASRSMVPRQVLSVQDFFLARNC